MANAMRSQRRVGIIAREDGAISFEGRIQRGSQTRREALGWAPISRQWAYQRREMGVWIWVENGVESPAWGESPFASGIRYRKYRQTRCPLAIARAQTATTSDA
ncbi:hypothetical protein N7470_009602 [Penicillium chermesinum]|nr:hypothetical protein N7470_009602 [Penicillium chermesinum]